MSPGSIHIPVCGIVHGLFMAAAQKPLCENFVITNCVQRIGCNEKGLPLGEALSALITALSHFSASRGDSRY
jgi:hypothetical protein